MKTLLSIENWLSCIIHKVMSAGFKMLGKEYDAKLHENFMQLVRYGIVGMSNTAVSYVIYACSLFWFKRNDMFGAADYLAAQALAFFISVLWSFMLSKYFVFKKRDAQQNSVATCIAELVKFYLMHVGTGLGMNSLLLYIWTTMGVSPYIAPFFNILFIAPTNFLLSKKWAFKA